MGRMFGDVYPDVPVPKSMAGGGSIRLLLRLPGRGAVGAPAAVVDHLLIYALRR